MTEAAVGGKLGGQMIGAGGIVIIRFVAGETIIGKPTEYIAFMTLITVQGFV
jgi:hypothetical protein